MRDIKFTPGPWAVSESPDYFDNGAVVVRATNKCVVAVLTDLDWPVKSAREANANLIATAPELLEALEDSITLLRCLTDMVDSPKANAFIVRQSILISKALGEKS